MSKQMQNIERKIAKMKLGETFTVPTEADRQRASKAGNLLRRAGVINFVVKTQELDGEFVVEAT